MVAKLTFSFGDSPESNDHEVRPQVDDLDILSVAPRGPYLGLDPPEFFCQPPLASGGELIVGRCGCGVVGCGDSIVTVDISQQIVTWTMSATQRFVFDRTQYLEAVKAGASETKWESLERTTERLVGALDFSDKETAGYRFQWASARIKRGQITLSFSKGSEQRLFEVGWDHAHAEDAVQRVRAWLRDDA